MASTWLTVLTFGKVITRPSGKLTGALQERAQEEIQRPQPSTSGRRLEALEAQSDERRGCPGGQRVGQSSRDRHGVGVLDRVGPRTVAVLEVQPEVLDRLGGQLGLGPYGDRLDQVLGHPDRATERHPATVRGHQGGRLGAPAAWQVDGVAVGRHVDGVHGLPPSVLTRVGPVEEGVGLGESGVQIGQHALVQARPPGRGQHAHLTSSYAGRVKKSVKSSDSTRSEISALAGT